MKNVLGCSNCSLVLNTDEDDRKYYGGIMLAIAANKIVGTDWWQIKERNRLHKLAVGIADKYGLEY